LQINAEKDFFAQKAQSLFGGTEYMGRIEDSPENLRLPC
jgi:hypothetical protein